MNASASALPAHPYSSLPHFVVAVAPIHPTTQLCCEQPTATTLSAWTHFAERLIDAAIHADLAGAPAKALMEPRQTLLKRGTLT